MALGLKVAKNVTKSRVGLLGHHSVNENWLDGLDRVVSSIRGILLAAVGLAARF